MSEKKRFYRNLSLMAVLLTTNAIAPAVLAQTNTATILGSVTDSSGAAIPQVRVTVKNADTGIAQTLASDAQGRYQVSNLIVGNYEVEASKEGFTTFIHKGIAVNVGSQSVVDFSLAVGQQQQTVTVEGQVSQVDTTTATVSSLVNQTQIRELPLNGRNLEQLILLAPGVQQIFTTNNTSFYGRAPTFSVAGSRPEGQAMLIDGEDVTNWFGRGTGASGLGTSLGVEAIAEFQTLTNTYSAQFGGAGAVMNSVTKSGANAFHGSAFEFLRNSALDARKFFDNFREAGSDHAKVPTFRRNQFGGSLGGPVKRDKAFFFFNYEGFRQALGETRQTDVPDANTRRGVINPVIAPYLNLYPVTNLVGTNGVVRIPQVATQTGSENYLVARFDYTISSNDTLFARYVRDTATLLEPFAAANVPTWPERDTNYNQFATLEERHIFSPNLVNLVRVSFSRPRADAVTTNSTAPLQFFPGEGRQDGTITISGINGQLGPSNLLPFTLLQNKFTESDDVYWTRGAHSIKFGGSIRRMQSNSNGPFRVGGAWTFTSLANFLAVRPSGFIGPLSGQADAFRDYREIDVTPYIHDDWKATSRLTVNLGLRYSFTTNPIERKGKMFTIVDPPRSLGFENVKHLQIGNPSLMNFDPRFGLAFDPFKDHKTSIRAGFGIFHNVLQPRTFLGSYALNPPFNVRQQQNPTGFPVPFGSAQVATIATSNGSDYRNTATPYMMQYNFTIQREIGFGTVFNIGYVGSQGRHLVSQIDQNPPIPAADGSLARLVNGAIVTNPRQSSLYSGSLFGIIVNKVMNSNSSYNGMQMELNKRMSHGFQTQLAYTWSKCIDNGSATTGNESQATPAAVMNPYNQAQDRGRCSFDIRQTMRLNGVYALPFRGNRIIEGWQLNGILSIATGPAMSVNTGFDQAGLQNGAQRPNYVPCANPIVGLPERYFDRSCFAIQRVGTFGNLGRTTFTGPGLTNIDFSLTKNTRIAEGINLQIRAEAFNIANRANFGVPGLGAFTQGTNGAANPNSTFGVIGNVITSAREIQFGAKIVF